MYKKSSLDNKLTVVTHSMKGRDSVAAGIWVKVGGRYEDETLKGAAHFLEHILFKGSKKYSCLEIKERVEGVGGSLNAFTSEEMTCYYVKAPARHLKSTFDVLADMVLNPLISFEDVEKERQVILEEIKMYNDLPQYQVMNLLDELVWPNHPLGMSLSGTIESVSGLSSERLRDFHRVHYNPSQIIVAAAGRISHAEIEELVRSKFGKKEKGTASSFRQAENHQEHPRLKILTKNIEQVHLALGVLGLPAQHEDRYALSVLNVILGGNMSSRLFNEVREKRGLAYSIGSAVKFLRDTGALIIRAGVDNARLDEAAEVILQELDKLKKAGIRQNEFKRAKEYLTGQIVLGLEDTLDHMMWLGESFIVLDTVHRASDVVAMIKKVKMSDLERLAGRMFEDALYNLAMVGPLTDAQQGRIHQILKV